MKENGMRQLANMGSIAFLNGQKGLEREEQEIYRELVSMGKYPIVLDNLFENPIAIFALSAMKIDTVILSTTNTYRDKMNMLIDVIKKMDYYPDNAMFLYGEDDVLGFLRYCKTKNPNFTVYKIYPFFTDEEKELLLQAINYL